MALAQLWLLDQEMTSKQNVCARQLSTCRLAERPSGFWGSTPAPAFATHWFSAPQGLTAQDGARALISKEGQMAS